QPERGPSFGQRVLLGNLGGIGVPAAVEAEVLGAPRLQAVLRKIHAAGQLGSPCPVHHEYLGAPESEPECGLAPLRRSDEKGDVLVAHALPSMTGTYLRN